MKKNYFFLILLALSTATHAQINFGWVSSLSGSSVQISGTKVTSDANGNIYTTGTFQGSRPFGTYTLTSLGISDAYVAKYDNAGNCVWAQSFGYSTSTTTGNNICVDNSGNVYVCGGFTNTLQIDTNYYFALGQTDNFLIKLDPNGTFIRIKISGGQSVDNARALTVDPQNNVYMAGEFGYKAFFDNDSVITAGASSLTDIFITKYSASGSVQWVKKAGGPDNDGAFAIHYRNNRLYVAGVFIGAGSFPPNSVNASGTGTDAFIAKYDLAGNNLWVKKAGGSANDYCYDMSTDSLGNAYLTGSIILTASFGTLPPIVVGNYPDAFIAKIDSGGSFIYAKKAGSSTLADNGSGIASDVYGYTVITGSFSGTASFPPFSLTSIGSGDIFIAKYNSSGACQYAIRAGGSGNDLGSGVTWLSSVNEFIIAGNYQNSASFGTLTITAGATYASFLTNIPGYYTGIKNVENFEDAVLAYPNPVAGMVHIQLKDFEDAESLNIVNVLGQVVFSEKINPGQNNLMVNVSQIDNGIYTARINTSNSFTVCKFQVVK